MRIVTLICLALGACLTGTLAAFAAIPEKPVAPVNLVSNGDFEKAGDGAPLAGWKTGMQDGGMPTQDTMLKKGGTASLKLAVTKKGNAWAVSDAFTVKAGSYYLMNFVYRAEGFGDKGWQGADASARILFIDEKNAQMIPPMGNLPGVGYQYVAGFPYADVPEWRTAATLIKAPAGAVKASFQVAANSAKDEISPTIWLDNVAVREYIPAEAKGKAITFKPNAPLHLYNSELVNGMAVSTKDKQKAGTLLSGPYTKDIPCGLYAVTFRMKTADNTTTTPLLQVGVESDGVLGSRVMVLRLNGTDFKTADAFQEFTVPAFKPATGWLAFPIYWSGEATVTLESVTITEITLFTPEEWVKFAQ